MLSTVTASLRQKTYQKAKGLLDQLGGIFVKLLVHQKKTNEKSVAHVELMKGSTSTIFIEGKRWKPGGRDSQKYSYPNSWEAYTNSNDCY